MSEQVVVLEIALPSVYTDDLDGLREYMGEHQSESEWLLNCIGEPGPACRLRVEISGEKDGEVQEVWGHVRGARLVTDEPSNVDEAWLAKNGRKLLRDEDSCEWCDHDHNAADEEDGSSG